MTEEREYQEAMMIEHQAWELVDAFDGAAEDKDRRVAYAALIMLMTNFAKGSTSPVEVIMSDFAKRIFAGVNAERSLPQ